MVALGNKKGMVSLLKLFMKRLKDHLKISEEKETVPDDAREGYFAVLAVNNEEKKPIRFVVDLCVLKHPAFLRLLKMAEEEYGFQQKGTLTIPCRADDVWRIVRDKSWKSSDKRD